MSAGPETATESIWKACGASVTGREHERRGLGCDDAYGYGIAGDFVVAAVADGAGAVTGTSAWGAYAACQSVLVDALRAPFVTDYRNADDGAPLIRWLFRNALDRVTRQARTLGLDPALLSTTLCVALADPHRAVFGQIGDGVIAVEHGGRIESLLVEQKDDYANTTSFLQSENAFDGALRTAVRPGVTAFALSTDGMSYKITDVATGAAYEPFFRDSWHHVRADADAGEFAALLRGIHDDQTGDDKTMVLAAIDTRTVRPVEIVTDHSAPPARRR
ncbi:protein phosphatase 2C domain-containing protein [Mycolicibacterium litorale]|uniref:protein phosphatase 2C domain-containing protein n=1 Tax=Mycolicibacterium litorale TaxID=758802 RepID=UPI003CF13B49